MLDTWVSCIQFTQLGDLFTVRFTLSSQEGRLMTLVLLLDLSRLSCSPSPSPPHILVTNGDQNINMSESCSDWERSSRAIQLSDRADSPMTVSRYCLQSKGSFYEHSGFPFVPPTPRMVIRSHVLYVAALPVWYPLPLRLCSGLLQTTVMTAI